jgi:hypothetical protein
MHAGSTPSTTGEMEYMIVRLLEMLRVSGFFRLNVPDPFSKDFGVLHFFL